MEAEAVTGVPDDVFFGPIPYPAFLSIAGALFKIEGSIEYEQVIRKYFNHPNEQVRYWAEHALNVEGPTSKEGLSTRRSVTDSPADLGNWRKTDNTPNTRIGRSLGELSATRKLTHYQNYTRAPLLRIFHRPPQSDFKHFSSQMSGVHHHRHRTAPPTTMEIDLCVRAEVCPFPRGRRLEAVKPMDHILFDKHV